MSQLPDRAFFSPGDDCLQAILESINSAEHTLKICVFTISDNRITEAILLAHKRGIDLKLLTDNEKLFDKGSDIRELATKGVTVRIDMSRNHMHHKFAIIDDKAVLTGSYNWTRSAANYNHENILITNNPVITASYCKEFDKLWNGMETYEGKTQLWNHSAT